MYEYNMSDKINDNVTIVAPEPILQENSSRFVLFPIKHKKLWDAYKIAEASFWTAEEIDFSKDTNHQTKRIPRNFSRLVGGTLTEKRIRS